MKVRRLNVPRQIEKNDGFTKLYNFLCITLNLDVVLQVGQMQLLRRQIANELNFSCKFDSKHFESSLNTLNQ